MSQCVSNNSLDNFKQSQFIYIYILTFLSEGSQALPARTSDKGSVKVKKSEWLEAVA
jgi:hypothetical protein